MIRNLLQFCGGKKAYLIIFASTTVCLWGRQLWALWHPSYAKLKSRWMGSPKCLKHLREITAKDFTWGKVGEPKEKKAKEFSRALLALGRTLPDL